MSLSFDRSISYKLAAQLGLLLLLPFTFALTTAITHLEPALNLIASNGRATPFGLAIFYIGLIGLPLAFLVNLLSMLSLNLKFSKWGVDGKIAFHPKTVNMIIAIVGLLVAIVFGGHLIADAIACHFGNIPACD